MRIIAIDYGKARIGIAITDITKTIAYPFKTIKSENTLENTTKSILNAINDYKNEIELIIIGLPLLLKGTLSQMALEIKELEAILKTKTPIPIKLIDERFSTVIAEKDLKQNLKLNRKKRSKIIDSVTASVILQNYLL